MSHPLSIGDYYDTLFHQHLNLRVEFDVYHNWYGIEEHCQLIERIDGEFFLHLRQILHDSIILGIARLLDPKQSCGKPNLSLERFYDDVVIASKPSRWDEIWQNIQSRKSKFKFIRIKHIAHADYEAYVTPDQVETDWVSRQDIKDMLDLVGELFCHYNEEFHGTTISDHPSHDLHGRRLLKILKSI